MKIDNQLRKARSVLHGRSKGVVTINPASKTHTFRTVQFTHNNKRHKARFHKKRGRQRWQLDYLIG